MHKFVKLQWDLYFKGSQVANTGPWMHWYNGSACVQDTSGDNERCRGES